MTGTLALSIFVLAAPVLLFLLVTTRRAFKLTRTRVLFRFDELPSIDEQIVLSCIRFELRSIHFADNGSLLFG